MGTPHVSVEIYPGFYLGFDPENTHEHRVPESLLGRCITTGVSYFKKFPSSYIRKVYNKSVRFMK